MKRIIFLSDQLPEQTFALVSSKNVKRHVMLRETLGEFYPEIIFVLVYERQRNDFKNALKLLEIDLPIIEYADCDLRSDDNKYVFEEVFIASFFEKHTDTFFGVCRRMLGNCGVPVLAF